MKKLTDSQIKKIQRASEEIIEDVGFNVSHREIRHRAKKAGARVDEAGSIIRMPKELLRELLTRVPCKYYIAGMGGNEVTIGGGKHQGVAIVTDPWIIDYETQSLRRPCLEDIRQHTIIADKLDQVAGISRMDFPVTDVDGPLSSMRALEEHLMYHTKHYWVMPTDIKSFRQWLEIGRILLQGSELGGSRLMTIGVAVVSPLILNDLNAELLLGACEHNFAVVPTVCPMAGATSPYSRASTLLTGNVENIFLAALTQIMNPGNPFLYTFGPSVTDMRSGYNKYYTLDKVLWKLAGVQMARSYNIPTSAECGGTLTYRYDQQSGAEGILFMKAAYDSKADVLAGFGSCHNANGMSAEMMLVQTAWLEAAEYLERGIDTGDNQLGLKSIKRVGPGGNFLTDDLTIENLRAGKFFFNDLFDFSGGEGKSVSMLERAHEKVDAITEGVESPLPGNVQEDLKRYFHDEYMKINLE